jgi:hypothetical protein
MTQSDRVSAAWQPPVGADDRFPLLMPAHEEVRNGPASGEGPHFRPSDLLRLAAAHERLAASTDDKPRAQAWPDAGQSW